MVSCEISRMRSLIPVEDSEREMTMGFDAAWFDELRQLNANIIKQVPVGQGRFYPDIGDLWYDNSTILHVFTNRFFEEISQLTCQLRQSGIPFHRFFKIASERHIIDFPEHTCCLCQWNIGFSAGAISNHDMVRVGIGFRLNDSLENRSYQSYQDYLARVRRNPTSFNNLIRCST